MRDSVHSLSRCLDSAARLGQTASMQFSGDAIILSVRKFAEHGAVVKLFDRERGLYSGVCKHALAKAHRGTYQVGNRVHAQWGARLEEHLGTVSAELLVPIAALVMQDRQLLLALSSAAALCQHAMQERDPHPAVYDALHHLLMQMALGEEWLADYAQFELLLLSEAGFGLDVSQCAATGQTDDLCYVSPKSGCAVSREAGVPYHAKLLPLPAFLREEESQDVPTRDEVRDALILSGYFLHHWLLEPHGKRMPPEREQLVALLGREQVSAALQPMAEA